ncbi:MAG: response regulator transcription factor [Clostridia bacterium]|nr:response regulator transcription factor [Clostridia bacterium]
MFKILVVEDDPHTRLLFGKILEQNGYSPLLSKDGVDALEKMDHEHVDLVLLDVMMPRMNGFEFARTLRETDCQIPILMVTAKEGKLDKKEGFLAGTDDYMTKPVDEEEMLLRIAALLRRSKINASHKIEIGETVLDYDSLTVSTGEGEVLLPQKEFLVLFKLLSFQNKIFTRRQLMDEIWNFDSESDERTVDVHIHRLRERFESSPDFEIVTIRGLGYKAVKKNG